MKRGISWPIIVEISPTLGIRGIIAVRSIKLGEIIERAPAIIYRKNPNVIKDTVFDKYVFDWDTDHEALALGYGSLYNHHNTPNVEVDFDREKREIVFKAKRNIKLGDELFISYGDGDNVPVDEEYFSFDKEIVS